MIKIKETSGRDLTEILTINKTAFNGDDEANLVEQLLNDETAKPFLSLMAIKDDRGVGHILFTKVSLENSPTKVNAQILAPLAVMPDCQKQGIGSLLIKKGLQQLHHQGCELVFVLGYPEYYTRFGFQPAGKLGFFFLFPILEKNADAWMVMALNQNIIGFVQGEVECAKSLDKPEYWRE